ncbi:MAG: UDP-N-acetylmuramate:L-alanyl-gamma-D-glutamyl-meso-diaminopimelate ligase [Gammaproteobacteria bacterium]
MHIHILGICGTFMGGLALLARALGHRVTGSDANVYPPMSTQLQAQGIELMEGYHAEHLQPAPDMVVVGNALSRGNAAIEYMLDQGLSYRSGPQWLAEEVLPQRWVLAVAGTHGKSTTASLLAWVLEDNQLAPGFLIGAVPDNFGVSARLGATPFFVIEADEYDTAFFDKRSKFVHYGPRTLVLNNLEFDHADIFPDLAAIERQFHHLVRVVPGSGLIIENHSAPALQRVLQQGVWTPTEAFNSEQGWQAQLQQADGSVFDVYFKGKLQGRVRWDMIGEHSVSNALATLAAARHVGITPANAIESLARFKGLKRRMELRGEVNDIRVYDDFAHHPTAITTTLRGLRNRVGEARIIAILEPRSNTMRMGVQADELSNALQDADEVWLYQSPQLGWDPARQIALPENVLHVRQSVATIVEQLAANLKSGDHVLIMSNGGFENIHQRLLEQLARRK